MMDPQGREEKRRRRARILGRIGRAVMAVIAVTTAVYAVVGAVSLVPDQGDQNTYDKAPYCADVSKTQNCVLRTVATVDTDYVGKNTGRSAHGYTTTADLTPLVGRVQNVTLSKKQDLSYLVHGGDKLSVLVWGDQITRFTFDGQTHDSGENPHHVVAVDLTETALCLMAAAIFGRPLIRRPLRARTAINLRRNRIPDWTLAWLALVTAVAAVLRASYVVTVVGLAGIAVLLLSAAWPFIPWVATLSETALPFLSGPRSAAAARKRRQAQQWLP